MAIETWLPVVGYEGLYEVSDQGRVRSLDRYVPNHRWPGAPDRLVRGRVLYPLRTGKYHAVKLSKEGDIVTRKIEWLVLEAFVGPRPADMESCHLHDNGHDNRLENLRWDTRSNNHYDAVRNGTYANQNTKKTSCKYGHPFSDENTWRDKRTGKRQCRTCMRRRSNEYWKRKAEK